jgi:hypothetical protein
MKVEFSTTSSGRLVIVLRSGKYRVPFTVSSTDWTTVSHDDWPRARAMKLSTALARLVEDARKNDP